VNLDQSGSLKRFQAEFRRGVRVHDQKIEFEFELNSNSIFHESTPAANVSVNDSQLRQNSGLLSQMIAIPRAANRSALG
jgi:hypothetical protein